jgi:hypothetical protein
MLTDAQTSIAPLAEELRVKVTHDPDKSETYLRNIGDALRYLKDEFDSSYAGDVGWSHAAKALEIAHSDATQTAHAIKALKVFLQGCAKIVTPDPAVQGMFVSRSA